MTNIYSLYIKTHKKTGLKYLGFTKNNPFKYKGSGKYWKRHIRIHGNEVDTRILFQTISKLEIKQHGLHYSNLWNIVESTDWANLKPEDGYGGGPGPNREQAKKISKTKNDPLWKATIGLEQKRKELITKNDSVWQETVWTPAVNQMTATKNDPLWKATTGKEQAKKLSNTQNDPVWKVNQTTQIKDRTNKRLKTISAPEWKETTGTSQAKKVSISCIKTKNDPVWKATVGKQHSKNLSKATTGRKRCYLPDGTWTWQYPKK